MQILLVDQFAPTPSPYELFLYPPRWDAFVAQELARPRMAHVETPTQLLDVAEDYEPPRASRAYRAAADGTVQLWKQRIESD